MVELTINGVDAYATYGVKMGDGFLNAILLPPPLKDYITNECRAKDGTEYIVSNIHVKERELNLTFVITGDTESDYLTNFAAFLNVLHGGNVIVTIPSISTDKYRLIYKQSTSIALSVDRCTSKLVCKFTESNPNNRK